MTPFSRPITSPYWQEDQARLQRIRSLERRPNLTLSEQIQLGSERNTLQNLRSEALRESKFRIEEKESLLKERELDEAMSPQPTRGIQNQPSTPAQSNIPSLFSQRQQQLALQNMGSPLAPIVRGPTTYTGVGRDNPEFASNRPTTAPMGGMGGMGQLPQPMMMPQQSLQRTVQPLSERFPLMAEASELERLRMAAEGSRLQSQMRFQPQMDAIRQGIMGRMAGRLGTSMMPPTQPYSSGSGYTPSWMQNTQRPSGSSFNPLLNQNFQTPQFPV